LTLHGTGIPAINQVSMHMHMPKLMSICLCLQTLFSYDYLYILNIINCSSPLLEGGCLQG
jgi:hypothetical protein